MATSPSPSESLNCGRDHGRNPHGPSPDGLVTRVITNGDKSIGVIAGGRGRHGGRDHHGLSPNGTGPS